MAVRMNRRVTLAARPEGFPKESNFVLDETEVPQPAHGEVLVRALFLSVDPYQRGRMSTARSYARSLELGDVITSQTLGEVIESRHDRYQRGDLVVGQLGWQEFAVARGGALRKVHPALEPPSLALGAVGTTGFTAYFGLLDVGRPRAGDTVVVSAAAGAVGQIVGQLARLCGCRTVGICGGPDKVRQLRELYRYDVAIDYRNDDLGAALKEACPDGVNVYFDNVGGEITDTVLRRLAIGAGVVVCGQISQYNLERPELAPRNLGLLIVYRARIEGFLVTDYAHRFDEAAVRLSRWIAADEIRYREDVTEGLENAPLAFMRMLRGENEGKTLVKLL